MGCRGRGLWKNVVLQVFPMLETLVKAPNSLPHLVASRNVVSGVFKA